MRPYYHEKTTYIYNPLTINILKMKKIILLFFVLLIISCKEKKSGDAYTKTASGLQYKTIKEGSGTAVKVGDEVLIHETMSYSNDSLLFDSRTLPTPVKMLVGGSQAIQGVDEGIRGMQEGEIRKLIVPPALSKRSGNPTFPHPDSILVYEVEVIEIVNKPL